MVPRKPRRANKIDSFRLSQFIFKVKITEVKHVQTWWNTEAYCYAVVYYPAVYGIVSRDPEEAFGRRFLDFWTRLQASEMLTYNILCGILPTAHIRQGQFQQYAGIYAQVNGGSPAGAEIARPAGQYLVAYHHGSDHSIGKTYQRMLDYATAHGLQVGEYAFEEYLIYEIAAQQEDQLVTKLLISLSPDSHTPSSLRRRRSALRL